MRIPARTRVVVTAAFLSTLAIPAAAQDALIEAKNLYDAASYSEALSALNKVGPSADVADVEKYRALCLLALDRPKDAEQSLQRLATARPLLTLNDTDAPPKLVAVFQEVRKRTMPDVAKQVYQRGRASFDSGDMKEAARQFKEVIALADTAPPEHAALMSELKMLAVGFVALAERAEPKPQAVAGVAVSADPVPQGAAKATSPASAAATPGVARVDAAVIFDSSNAAVTPPVVVSRTVPQWERPDQLRRFALRGILEVVVDEQGAVSASKMITPLHPRFDAILMTAATTWRYQPATLGGRPVKYRLTYGFSMDADRP